MDGSTIAAITAAVGVPVAGALIAIGAALAKREQPPPPPHQSQPTIPPVLVTQTDLDAVKRLAEEAMRRAEGAQGAAGSAKDATTQMLPRLARCEEDIREHDGILRTAEVNIGKIGERLAVKLERRDGKQRESS